MKKKQRQNIKNLLIILTVILITVIVGYYAYQAQSGPLPYEAEYEQFNEEQGLPGLDYEYTGPNAENPVSLPSY